MARNSRRGVLPAAAFVVIAAAAWVYAYEPHVFERDSVFRRDLPRSGQAWLDAVECHTQLQPEAKTLAAEVHYRFGKDNTPAEVEFITNAGLRIDALRINGTDAAWSRVPDTDRVKISLPAGPQADVEFRYSGRIRYPRRAVLPDTSPIRASICWRTRTGSLSR